jgi:hypothetical protein
MINKLRNMHGGRCGIRTHEGLAPLPVFKTGAFNRSANLPCITIDDPASRTIEGGL